MKKLILATALFSFISFPSFSQGKKKGHYKHHHSGKKYYRAKRPGATVVLPPRPPLPPLPPKPLLPPAPPRP